MAVALLEVLGNAGDVLVGGLVAMAGEVDVGIGLGVLSAQQADLGGVELMAEVAVLFGGIGLAAQAA